MSISRLCQTIVHDIKKYYRNCLNTIIISSRFITRPVVNSIVNHFAFLPPSRTTNELKALEFSQNHNYARENNNKISYLVSKPNVYSVTNKCILFSHGNASDILAMSPLCDYWANSVGIDCICYDYLGYGLSKEANESTSPSEEKCYKSIGMIIKELENKYDTIYLVGQSLGTGVVVDYCAKFDWTTQIILISPYKSLTRIVADSRLSNMIDSSFNTMEKINNLKCPVKIFHGDADDLISITHGKEIYDNLSDKTLTPTWLRGVGHNDILGAISLYEIKEVLNQ